MTAKKSAKNREEFQKIPGGGRERFFRVAIICSPDKPRPLFSAVFHQWSIFHKDLYYMYLSAHYKILHNRLIGNVMIN